MPSTLKQLPAIAEFKLLYAHGLSGARADASVDTLKSFMRTVASVVNAETAFMDCLEREGAPINPIE